MALQENKQQISDGCDGLEPEYAAERAHPVAAVLALLPCPDPDQSKCYAGFCGCHCAGPDRDCKVGYLDRVAGACDGVGAGLQVHAAEEHGPEDYGEELGGESKCVSFSLYRFFLLHGLYGEGAS